MNDLEEKTVTRMKGTTVVKPVVYGNVSRYFGKKSENGHTHQWTVFVKPFDNCCMSPFVKKVVFRLHADYNDHNRTVTEPPYEVTETGWGEFEVLIKIFFVDVNEKPVTLTHLLKLFHTDPDITLGKKPLIIEHYDEVIFQEPYPLFHKLLMEKKRVTCGEYKHHYDHETFKKNDFEQMKSVHKQVESALETVRHFKVLTARAIHALQEHEKESLDAMNDEQVD
ncbi:unnamed protein product [Dimorphilus gyrociliatus]|uniref:YEATS domain-containing protein n=1 Tax=Dimorphilus gyrociliatus TaxID=2664684 RepID=A0A7I8V970_9ANNE|nr:unnamed protein product [Dimorphilus gyrociliatus]